MKKQKQIYVSPETETLVVRFEGSLLTGSKMNVSTTMGRGVGYDYDDLDDD